MMFAPHRRPLWIGALLLVMGVGMLLFMNYAKFDSTLEGRERARHGMLAAHLAKTLEAQLALGLELDSTSAVSQSFEQELRHDPRLRAIAVLSDDGQIQFAATGADARGGLPALWRDATRAARDGRPMPEQQQAGSLAIALQNGFGVRAGWLALEYDLSATHKQAWQAFMRLWPTALPTLAIAILLLALVAPRIGHALADDPQASSDPHTRREQAKRAMRRLAILMSVLLMLVQGAIAWRAYDIFIDAGAEDAPRLAATFAHTLTPGLDRALAHGIPLDQLRGVDDWLQPAFAAGAEFALVAISDDTGRVLFKVANPRADVHRDTSQDAHYRFALHRDGADVGAMAITLDPHPLAERTRQLGIEFATLLVIGVLLSMEVLHGLLARHHPHHHHGEVDAREMLTRLRLPLFLYFTGSELPRAFLPMWAKQLAGQPLPQWWDGTWLAMWFSPFAALPETLRNTLPISLFLLTIALVSPFAGRQSARHGPLRLINIGLLLALCGHIAALLADSLLTLCVARVLTGASSGFITVATFDYIGRSGARARGMAVYLAAYVAAGICGSGLGSLLVDRAGTAGVFAIGIAFTLMAAASLMHMPRLQKSAVVAAPLAGAMAQLIRQPRFMALLLLIGLPMQLLQQGLLFYWAPLALSAQGEPTSFIGLTMMAYFFLVLLLNAPAARWADRSGRHAGIVLTGLAVAAGAALLSGMVGSSAAIAVSVALIGVVWAAGFPAQGALVLRLDEHDLAGVAPTVAIGVYRMIERIGAMLAAPAIALLVAGVGYDDTANLIGLLLAGCVALQGWVLLQEKRRTAASLDQGTRS